MNLWCARAGRPLGIAKSGCLLLTVLGVSVLYVCYLLIPMYVNKVLFEEDVGKIVRKAGAYRLSDSVIEDLVGRSAEQRGFKTRPKEIQIIRSSPYLNVPELKIEVRYKKIVKLPGYRHTFEFEASASTFLAVL